MTLFDDKILKALFRLSGTKFFLLSTILMLFFITSCDESSVVGINVIPEKDLLNVSIQDSSTLITKTIKIDSLRTDKSQLSLLTTNNLLGKYIDPIFGESSAIIYTQLVLNTPNPEFGTNPRIDSVILAMVYDSTLYGKQDATAQSFSVKQLTTDLEKDQAYYSSNSIATSNDFLAENVGLVPNPTTEPTINGKILKPQLRIPLSTNFGQSILDQQGTTKLSDNSSFQNYIKGLSISSANTSGLNTGEGNIIRLDLEDSESKLTVYYHNDSNDSLQLDFSMGSGARFSEFKHDYSSADPILLNQLNSVSIEQNETVFLQAMSGLKVKIEMPHLMSLNKLENLVINKAELLIKVDTASTYQLDTFSPPEKLVVFGINDDGSNYELDDSKEGTNYFGGTYNSQKFEYRINISRYIQQVLIGGRKNNGLHLLPLYGAINANRVVVGGGNNNTFKMQLVVTSSKLP